MSWTHLRDEIRKARKAHRCYLCDELIAQGEEHVVRTGITDDGHVSCRMHPECKQQTQDWDDFDWEIFSPGEFERPLLEPGDPRGPLSAPPDESSPPDID
jgi:hypothetical protein